MAEWSRLNQWLSSLYRAEVLREGNYEEIMRMFAREAGASEELRAAAEKRARELGPVVAARGDKSALVEAKQVEYITDMLKRLSDG